jgi:UDP-4-amino-4,6-dideoxy-N-acetyl-beta-L-altrosamine transaminase
MRRAAATMIPYSTQDISEQDLAAVREVMTSGWLTQGPVVPRFETEFAAVHEVRHAVAVSNATGGLHIGCLALGVGPGSRVWTSPNSFVASANCALYCGATVDFVDIDPHTRNMSVPALEQKLLQASRSGELPDVLVPVDFSGLPADLAEMRQLADRYGFKILEDASHAVGARYQGRPVGSAHAHATVFSFHPVKIITTGEGGLVATNDEQIAQRLQALRTHGITRDASLMSTVPPGAWYYEQVLLGFNYRLTDIQAALGCSQLQRLHEFHEQRCALAARYAQLLADLPLRLPPTLPDRNSSWHLYVVEIDRARCNVSRAAVFARLRERGIGVNVHYIPIHLQPYYRKLGFEPGQFPNSERYYEQALSLPLYSQLTHLQQDYVAAALTQALQA